MRHWNRAALALALTTLLATPVLAQSAGTGSTAGESGIGYNGWGVRVGASSDPDQIYGGFHWDLGQFAKDVRFRPILEFGFGDDLTLVDGMAEVTYLFSKVQVWKPYVGGDLGLAYVSIDKDVLPPGVDNTDTDLALMGVGGIETRLKSGTRFFMELKVGFGDLDPDFKLAAGWTWK